MEANDNHEVNFGRLPDKLDMSECQSLIKDKRDLYEALVRNGYHLPGLRSPICTVTFLHEVRNLTVWCPQKLLVHPHTCVQPPITRIVQAETVQQILGNLPAHNTPERQPAQRLAKYLQKRQASRNWLLDVLHSCLDGNHAYF